MKIKTINSRHRRDFTAIYICEHCGHEMNGYGYDDNHFHQTVIPKMVCPNCKKIAEEYIPFKTKYPASMIV